MALQENTSSLIGGIPNLKAGEFHEHLVAVRRYLHHYGYLRKVKDIPEGNLDKVTIQAIKKFQKSFNLRRTGDLNTETRLAMSQARCGLADRGHSLASVAKGPWDHKNITYAFNNFFQPQNTTAENAVRRAFQTWASTSVGLSFSEISVNDSPDILIECRTAEDPDFSMTESILAHADYPPPNSEVVQTPPLPLHFNISGHKWIIGAAPNSYDIETVALHEIGHCLGLDHSDVNGSVMWPVISSNFVLNELQADDIKGIQGLYMNT